MISCPGCRNIVADGDRFCEGCGSDLPEDGSMTSLGMAAVPGDPLCAECGEDRGQIDDGYCWSCGTRQPVPRDHMEEVYLGVAAITDRGRRHPHNQDAFALAMTPGGRVLAVVCDGVSTTASADEASQRAADAALAALQEGGDDHPDDALGDAFVAARLAVGEVAWSPATGELGSPSTTFLAVSAQHGNIEISSVGDCRALWLPHDGEAQILTEDDSWAAEQVRSATMTAEAAYADPRSHSITRWVGADADSSWEPRRTAFTVSAPGRLVLCSDGLWNYASEGRELGAVTGDGDPLSVGRRLVDYANGSGGHDNITVVVLDIAPSADIGDTTTKGTT